MAGQAQQEPLADSGGREPGSRSRRRRVNDSQAAQGVRASRDDAMTSTTTRPRSDTANQLRGHAMRLKGHPDATPTPQPKATGWHPLDWACEYLGTAGQLGVG